jgi:NADH:ubiquinone oxidoreductase subunit 2 (subunit N)
MAIYVAMTLGTFACILSMRRDGQMVENISDLSGLARTKPAMAFFLAMLLFSLAGIPPLAAFFAKFYVFPGRDQGRAVRARGDRRRTSVVGAYYYLDHREDHVLRGTGPSRSSHADRTQGRAGGHRPVQSPVLRLSRPAGRCGQRGGEVVVLNAA